MTENGVPRHTGLLIILSGRSGVGKTIIARALATALGAVHVRIDSIEQALRNAGLTVYDEGYRVGYAVAEDNVRCGRIVIADCVNPWPLTRGEWQAAADRAAARVLNVEIVCSDIVEHRRRVESRAPDIAGHTLPTWPEVIERDYRPWDGEPLIVDTARSSVEQCVEAIRNGIAHLPAVE